LRTALVTKIFQTRSVLFLFCVILAGLVAFAVSSRGESLSSAPDASVALDATPAKLLGGPVREFESESAAFIGVLAYAGPREGEQRRFFTMDGSVVVASSDPLSNLTEGSDGIKRYKARSGDTLSTIAEEFNITVETLKAANPDLRSGRALRLGQNLTILPVPGILYEVQEGDTLEEIASRYGVDVELIRRYNADYQKIFSLESGSVILPYAKSISGVRQASTLPSLKNYFAMPVVGWNWGELHDANAVDIANRCGTLVYAAADGLVVPDEVLGDGTSGWNSGYGLFVLVEHPNGTKTRYAHLGLVDVKIGNYVNRGDKIGEIGNTGNTHGPTGCHLHFEVYGAKNPFAVR